MFLHRGKNSLIFVAILKFLYLFADIHDKLCRTDDLLKKIYEIIRVNWSFHDGYTYVKIHL